MKKRVSAFLSVLLLCLLLLPLTARTAWADYDEIVRYDITVQPDTEDGSLLFTAEFTWKALEALPYGQELKIGIPNGSIREETALTDNIERLSFDNSYMYVYLDRKYDDGETFQFSYSWVQEYMYTLDEDGRVTYDYTPGWFDEARIDSMSVTWLHPQDVNGTLDYFASDPSRWKFSGSTATGTDLPHGAQVRLTVSYPDWPGSLDPEKSRENEPGGYDPGGYDPGGNNYDSGMDLADMIRAIIIMIIIIWVLYRVVKALGGGYAGGFGTRYVFYHNLWYPAGPDGKPKPGSVGTATKPKPPASSHSSSGGFGGGHRGGGFGGGGFGGGSHCACASSCACACACACAGGGRAGCSAKNLYGAIRLDEELSRRLEEQTDK